MENDHSGKIPSLSNWKEEAWKINYQGFNGKLMFFRLLTSNCLNWEIYCDDHSSLTSTTAVQYEFHIYFTRPSISVSPRWWPKPQITWYPQSISVENQKTHTTEKQCKSIKRNKAILFTSSSHESGHSTGPEKVKRLAIFPLPEQWVFPWDLPAHHQVMETVKDWNPENRHFLVGIL